VGFLGAGAILRSGERVTGLTTAAGIWVTAAIGVLFGSGFWIIGSGGTVLVLLTVNTASWASARATASTAPPDGDG
jgi:putative Mg2+ transporter-C (MgtC) family protein